MDKHLEAAIEVADRLTPEQQYSDDIATAMLHTQLSIASSLLRITELLEPMSHIDKEVCHVAEALRASAGEGV